METSRVSLLPRRQHAKIPHRLLLSFSFLAATAVPGGGILTVVSAASYPETQVLGLEALYNTTGGEQWASSTGWRDGALGVCEWFGIACDSSGQNVTGLSLSGNGLAGNLSDAAELFQVVSLQDVDLSDNELVGPVALGLGLMSGLEQLDLSRNGLSSFPSSWGSEASSLQHLSLRFNNISGTLPSEWLNVNSTTITTTTTTTTATTTSYPFVHVNETSSWLPELRTLDLGGNNIVMTVYAAMQSVVGLPSLQVLDLSSNALTGNLEGSFDLHYCDFDEGGSLSGGGGGGTCNTAVTKTRSSSLVIVLLASNLIGGGLEADSLPRSLSVLTLSDNLLHGPVPEDYSQLSVFFADANEGLNSTALPSFVSYASSPSVTVRHDNFTCPVLSGQNVDGYSSSSNSVHLRLDPSYLDYAHCVCAEGMEGNPPDDCHACPTGTFRGTAELFTSQACLACPENAGTVITGAESASQCKCTSGFYDTLAGGGSSSSGSSGSGGGGGRSCSACPYDGVGWDSAGAISVTACSCPAGRYMDEVLETCTECEAGTFKSSVGNDASLCVPCAKGTYSAETGGTSVDVCTSCGAGTYSASAGATESSTCLSCPSGTYSAASGLFSSELCEACPAGYYSEDEGATNVDVCLPCSLGKYSTEVGASSATSCSWCADGQASRGGSSECELSLKNSRKTLVVYLIVGASTLAGIGITYFTWQRKVNKKQKLMVDSRSETPLKMATAKRKAHMWAVFFHTLETLDVITGNALFLYLLDIDALQGLMQYIYWLVVSVGLVLNVYRLYKVVWMQCRLSNISVATTIDKEGKRVLVVHMPGGKRSDRRIMTPDDAKMVLELVKILKHLQVNKFKVQLAALMDLPLTFLNLYLLWMVEPELIQSALFLTSLIIAVFSAGKISTLIEYHLELRQRKRKLERLLLLELKSTEGGREDMGGILDDEASGHEEVDDCFEHGQPETLLKFHGESMRNIPTKDVEESPSPLNSRRKYAMLTRKYDSMLSPVRRSINNLSPRHRGSGGGVGGGGSIGNGRSWALVPRSPSPKRSRGGRGAQ